MWNLKRNYANEPTYKAERDSQTENELMVAGPRRDNQEVWDGHGLTAIFKMNNQKGTTVQHMKPFNVMWQPRGEGRLEEDGYMYIYG